METPEQVQTETESKGNSGLALSGLIQVLHQPAIFFERLANNPKVLIPWLAYFGLILASLLLIGDLIAKMQYEVIMERLADQGQEAPAGLPSMEQLKWSSIAFGSVFMMLTPLIAAGLGLFWGNVVMAGRASFKQLLSVMIYGEVIFGLGVLVMAPLMLAKGSMKVSLSLAALFQQLSIQDPLYLAASKIGVFYIWEIVVIGIGLSIVYGFSRNKGYTLAVLSMGLISVLHVLLQFAFGSMM